MASSSKRTLALAHDLEREAGFDPVNAAVAQTGNTR